VAVDANEVYELNERAISDLLLQRLAEACKSEKLTQHLHDSLRHLTRHDASATDQKQRLLAQDVKTILDGAAAQLVFLFDQFDAIYKALDGRFFANLRGERKLPAGFSIGRVLAHSP